MARRRGCSRWLLMVCLLLGASVHADAPKVSIASGEWAPYLGAALPGGGPVAQLVTAAFLSQGWQVSYAYYPWARDLELVRDAKVDVTLVWSKTTERARLFLFSDPVIRLKTVVFYNTKAPLRWNKPDDLKGKQLGGVVGYSYGFVTPDAGYHLDYAPDAISNFRMLAAGRLDGVLEELQVGQQIIHALGLAAHVSYDPKPIKDNPFFLMVGQHNPRAQEILTVFNRGLVQLRQSGRYDALLPTTP